MNMFNRVVYKIIAAVLPAMMLFSCGGNGEEIHSKETEQDAIVQAAVPSLGIGRDFSEETTPPVDENSPVICIDPGHGFDDGGASSEFLGGLNEDDITLAVSLMLDEELRKLGYQTVLTHNGQEFPITSAYDNNNKYRPQERVAFANSVDIDYYVSIHCNSHDNPSTKGTRIYYFDGPVKTEHTSGVIAERINSAILDSLEPGSTSITVEMTENVFYVIRETTVPASLIEMGFLTNESDAAKMLDEEWQRAFACGVAAGIDGYYRSE